MKDYTCYLFDVDGTLLDTAELIFRCFEYTCRRFAGIEADRDAVVRHIGLPLRRQLEVYMGPLTDERAREITAAHMEFQLSIYEKFLRPFPTVPEGMALLKRAGKRIGAVTSRKQRTLNLYLEQTALREYFDVLVSPEMTSAHKPGPEPAMKALEILGCTARESLMIGDSSFDIECGAGAGMDTAFVAWSHNDASLLPVAPTYVITDLRLLGARGT
ncbi:MAG: HAD-IA family hydrolase [Chitinivibrionales bacterium]|nr:HAD-IA family hydrolase [Chitinivibrionales bacterium]MBD3394494.1 HAD-IA family hydrolase [Chitinivibrionales bacterium]